MKDFNQIFELQSKFVHDNDIILSYYQKHLSDIDNINEQKYKTSFDHYLSFTDDINNRLAVTDDLVRTMSLLIEREQFVDYVMFTNGLNK